MSDIQDPVFKGCTRPAMIGGVPQVAFVLAVFPFLSMIGINIAIPFLALPSFLICRFLCRKDDFYFHLIAQNIRFLATKRANRKSIRGRVILP